MAISIKDFLWVAFVTVVICVLLTPILIIAELVTYEIPELANRARVKFARATRT